MQMTMKKKEKNPLEELYFPVSKVPVTDYLNSSSNLILPSSLSHYIVVETPKGPMAVQQCSEDYQVITNREIFEPLAEKLLSTYDVKIKVTNYRFSKFYVDFIINNEGKKLKKDDIFPRMRGNNSYDGSMKYSANFGLHRVFCDNGASLPIAGKNFSIKMMHTPAAGDEAALRKTIGAFDQFIEKSGDIIDGFKPLMQKKMTLAGAQERMNEISDETDYPKKQLEAAAARLQFEHNAGYQIDDYLIYNALNFALYHAETAQAPHKRDKVDNEVLQFLIQDNS